MNKIGIYNKIEQKLERRIPIQNSLQIIAYFLLKRQKLYI